MTTIVQIKVVILGDESVGKTSLLQKWIHGSFESGIAPTVGGATSIKQEVVDGVNYSFQIWDTAGAERYRALTPLYTRDAAAAMIVFDMTKQTSVNNIQQWIDFINEHGSMPFILVGNKEDLETKYVISQEDAQELAFRIQSQFFATSAKTGAGVDLAFRQLECTAVEYYKKSGSGGTDTLVAASETQKSSGCC